jgi:hypothetical protein
MAAFTLKKETTIEIRNTSGTAKPRIRYALILPQSKSSATRRRPLVAYHYTAVNSGLATARLPV